MTQKPEPQFLDITNDICPMTFVRAKIMVERLAPGASAIIRLKGTEPLGNVPRSLAELGHIVESLAPEPGEGPQGVHRFTVTKRAGPA